MTGMWVSIPGIGSLQEQKPDSENKVHVKNSLNQRGQKGADCVILGVGYG